MYAYSLNHTTQKGLMYVQLNKVLVLFTRRVILDERLPDSIESIASN